VRGDQRSRGDFSGPDFQRRTARGMIVRLSAPRLNKQSALNWRGFEPRLTGVNAGKAAPHFRSFPAFSSGFAATRGSYQLTHF
jgi:hypothetical protein